MKLMDKINLIRERRRQAVNEIADLVRRELAKQGYYTSVNLPSDASNFTLIAGPRRTYTVQIIASQETCNDIAEEVQAELEG